MSKNPNCWNVPTERLCAMRPKHCNWNSISSFGHSTHSCSAVCLKACFCRIYLCMKHSIALKCKVAAVRPHISPELEACDEKRRIWREKRYKKTRLRAPYIFFLRFCINRFPKKLDLSWLDFDRVDSFFIALSAHWSPYLICRLIVADCSFWKNNRNNKSSVT